MKSKLQIILYVTSFPMDLFGWFVVLLMRLLWGENLRWESPFRDGGGRPGGPVLTCDLKPGSFPVAQGRWPKGFYLHRRDGKEPVSWGATTFGHAIFYGPGRRKPDRWLPIQVHEHVHVEQYEAAMLGSAIAGLIVALFGMSWIGLVLWALGGLFMGTANWTTAVLRGEDAYRGSHHEEAAYAIDDAYAAAEREKE